MNELTVEKARKWLQLFEKYSTSWFFIGILLTLVPENGIILFDFSILPPATLAVQTLFRLLGFSLAVSVIYLFLEKKMGASKFLAMSMMTLWMLSLLFLSLDYFKAKQMPLTASSWKYDLATQKFSIVLSPTWMREHHDKSFVFLVRKQDAGTDRDTDPLNIIVKRPIKNTVSEEPYDIDCSKIATNFHLGDKIEICVLTVDSKVQIDKAKTLNQILDLKAENCFDEPKWCTMSLVQVKDVMSLGKDDQLQLINNLKVLAIN